VEGFGTAALDPSTMLGMVLQGRSEARSAWTQVRDRLPAKNRAYILASVSPAR